MSNYQHTPFQRQRYKANDVVVNGCGKEHPEGVQSKQTETRRERESEDLHHVDHLAFGIDWVPVEHSKDDTTADWQSGGNWGLLCPVGQPSWTDEIIDVLAGSGIRLRMITDMRATQSLKGVVSLWDSGGEVVSQAKDFAKQALAQVQVAIEIAYEAPIVWLTRQAIATNDQDEPTGIGASPLWGLMRTVRSEHPELRLCGMDVGKNRGNNMEVLVRALRSSAIEPEIAIRQGQLLVPRMHRMQKVLPTKAFIRTDGAVLITGGLSGLGAHIARWLTHSYGVRDIVLTSRRGRTSPGANSLINELEEKGATITVMEADIADAGGVHRVMAAFGPNRPLRGIVHAAGVIEAGVTTSLTPQQLETTFAPKIAAWHLHQTTKNLDLDVFVLLSSISGVLETPGLGNYAAANAFLDSLAHMRSAQGLPATSIAYGPWDGAGMAAHLVDTTRIHLKRAGLHSLKPAEGLALLDRAVSSGQAFVVGAALDLQALHAHSQQQRRTKRSSTPPILRALLQETSQAKSRQAVQPDDLSQMLGDTTPKQRASIVLRVVCEVVASTLGMTSEDSIDEIDVNRSLQDLGIDSLSAVLRRNQLAARTGLKLSANIVLFHPNLNTLSQALLAQLEASNLSKGLPSSPDCCNFDLKTIHRGYLDRSVKFESAAAQTGPKPSAGRVFLTGGTGFVGAFILRELLHRRRSVTCLVRAESQGHAQDRLIGTLQTYGLWQSDYAELLRPLIGDMSQPLFGLSNGSFNELAKSVDTICHAGALVDWMRPLEAYLGPNVVSTHEILRLASRGRSKAVHLISTVSTLSKHMGFELPETAQEYGYGTSKYTAERMLSAARMRGARAHVYRLPFVSASSASGHFRCDRGDFLHNLIVGCLEMGAFPSLPGADLSAVMPVDYLAQTIVEIMTRDHEHGVHEDYDFANPEAPSFEEYFRLLVDATQNGSMSIERFAEWQQRVTKYCLGHPESALARIAAVLDGFTEGNAAEMMKVLPVAGKHVLGAAHSAFPAPVFSSCSVARYLERIGEASADGALS